MCSMQPAMLNRPQVTAYLEATAGQQGSLEDSQRAWPKSASWTMPCLVIRMLPGLMSLCMTPA